MKSYPSIMPAGKLKDPLMMHVFDKIDGSNIRFEWSHKSGWTKYGTRNRLFDETDPIFGCAVEIFHTHYADILAKICLQQKWGKVTFFGEFFGRKSFAGVHYSEDLKDIVFFDVDVYKKGILPPAEFLRIFDGQIGIPNYLGYLLWDRDLLLQVNEGSLAGVTYEGVVGKAAHKNKIVMVKAKSKKWRDKVLFVFGEEKGSLIIDS